MEEQGQGQSEEKSYSGFVGRFCKVVYSDSGQVTIAKGIIKSIDGYFLHIKGDYSEALIALSKITKIEVLD